MIKIRMCVCCRKRLNQANLLRLQAIKSVFVEWTLKGRSFYLCENCIENKNYVNMICKIHKNNDDNSIKILKEIVYKWQKNNHQK